MRMERNYRTQRNWIRIAVWYISWADLNENGNIRSKTSDKWMNEMYTHMNFDDYDTCKLLLVFTSVECCLWKWRQSEWKTNHKNSFFTILFLFYSILIPNKVSKAVNMIFIGFGSLLEGMMVLWWQGRGRAEKNQRIFEHFNNMFIMLPPQPNIHSTPNMHKLHTNIFTATYV